MDKFKRFLIWAVKVISMTGLFTLFGYGFAVLVFSQLKGGLLNGSISKTNEIIDFCIVLPVLIILYIFICIKVSRIDLPKPDKKDKFSKKLKQPLMIIIPVAVIVIGYFFIPEIKTQLGYIRMENVERSADEVVVCGTGSKGKSKILIDYDKKSIIFSGYSFEKIKEFELNNGTVDQNKYNFQFSEGLSYPGKSITTFYNRYDHLTSAAELELENGQKYFCEFEEEYLAVNSQGFKASVLYAQKKADEVVVYGKNKLPENEYGVDHDTIYVNYDDPNCDISVYILCNDNYHNGLNGKEIRFFKKFQDTHQNDSSRILQAEIPVNSTEDKLYIWNDKDKLANGTTDTDESTYFTFSSKDGTECHTIEYGRYNFDDCLFTANEYKLFLDSQNKT